MEQSLSSSSGFILNKSDFITELNSKAYYMTHTKSGARLLYIKNEDDNKVFSITFKTPPKDSTGTPHILEHSVLCGSRKFPVKEPFVELAKGSLNTFLNAMTFSDKTMYPIASKNQKDFRNLMDVYLDAVFFPDIYKYKEILMQEGWHYDIDDKDKDITIKGVVYNEMKGAFSSPESLLMSKSQEALFPDTPYGFESGGDPKVIPQLTYEGFIDFHKKYYHPSNSFIYLYGNLDIEDTLSFIDKEYLSKFDKISVDSDINEQSPFSKMAEEKAYYPISNNEKEQDKTYLSLNFAVSKITDSEKYLAFDILENMLLETEAAPLKNALIDANIGKDVFGYFNNEIYQNVISIIVKNSNEKEKEKFKDIVFSTLKRLADEGIDKKLIESSINSKEFILREAEARSYPKGLLYNIKVLDSALFFGDPIIHLTYERDLAVIKKAMDSRYFEDLIEKYILNNNHSALVIIAPKKGLNEEADNALKAKLKAYKESLKEEEIEALVKNTLSLRERQEAEDSQEDIEKIPLISIEDIEKNEEKLNFTEDKFEDSNLLYHEAFTGKIAYVNSYFDTASVPEDKIPYINLLSYLLGKLNTSKYSYIDLSNEININTGGIYLSAAGYSDVSSDKIFFPKLIVKSKSLDTKLPELMRLLGEIIEGSTLEDKARLKNLIAQAKSQEEMGIYSYGHLVAMNRTLSYFSPAARYNEILNGISYYKFISDLDKNFDKDYDNIVNNLKTAAKSIFNKKNLLISVTCDKETYEKVKKNLPYLYSRLGSLSPSHVEYSLKPEGRNEGLLTPGKVQYVAKGFNFKKLGYEYSGSLQVLKSILALNYLWNNIRVLGGAYGGFANFRRNGGLVFASYRDPNLRKTLKVYDEAFRFINNFNPNEREMTKYIIGTMSNVDSPLTPSMEGERIITDYITNMTYDMRQQERDQILKTNINDIKAAADMVKAAMDEGYFCVLGSEEEINANKELFTDLVYVFS